MRLPVLAAVVLTLVVAPVAAVGTPVSPATSADAVTAENTISGTVSYLNGTPVAGATVLVGNQSLFENASTDELRNLAADPPADVATARTNESGAYALTVNDSVNAEAVIAVSPNGVSQLRRYQSGTVNLTLRTTEPLSFETSSVTSEPGGRATVTFTLEHTGDQPVEGLKLTLGSLPDGWNIASSSSETATYYEANRTFTWGTVAPGETVSAELKLFVAIEAIDEEAETFQFPMFAGSSTHPVDAEPIEVTVRYPTERPERTRTDIPGFGVPLALAALAATALLARRRRS
ncbi:MAG: PGF-CTERM sorting domain-containing protein [Halolamina sp.]